MNLYKFKMTGLALCLSLITSLAFAQTPDTSWFKDVTREVGLGSYNTNVGACIAVDVNNDNYPDLILLNGLGSHTGWALYINEERPGSSDPTDRIFVDETANSGLNVKGVYKDLAGAGDFDNDGNVDIVFACWTLDNQNGSCQVIDPAKEHCRIFWGDGHGHFTIDSVASGTPVGLRELGVLNAAGLPALDYDRDGNLDLFIACHFDGWCSQNATPAHLMHNNGNRTFTEETTAMGINVSEKDTISHPTYFINVDPDTAEYDPPAARALFGANVFDYNNDCWPDIFGCPYEAIGYPFYHYSNESIPSNEDSSLDTRGYGNLYQNNGGTSFKDVAVRKNWVPHVAWSVQGIVPWAAMPADYNNDGNMDFLAVLVHGVNQDSTSQYNYPYEDPNLGLAGAGNGRTCIFTNLGPDSGYRFKFDVGRINRRSPLNVTHGDHNGIWADFNNSGHQDLIIGDAAYSVTGYPDYQRMFFEFQDTLTHDFDDITQALGFCDSTAGTIAEDIRRPSVMLPVDFDLDGDDDILKMPYSSPDSITLFRNNIGNKNNHITIKLVGGKGSNAGANYDCIGARIYVRSGNIKQMKEIYGDQGQWTNQYPFIQNFGLGKRTVVDTIEVRWPDNNCTRYKMTNVAANQFITIYYDSTTSIMPVGPNTPNNFQIYPNPDFGANINVKFQGPVNPFIEIFNDLGQQVADFKPGYSSSFSLPINNLPAGLYFMHVIGIPGTSVMTEPFVITTKQ